jgi:hypothetical protein
MEETGEHRRADTAGDGDPAETEATAAPRSTLAPWLLRLFARTYEPESEIQKKHRQIIELIWTRRGMGERYFTTLQPPGVSYGTFVRRVTQLLCRGAAEGWVRVRMPAAPTFDDSEYGLEFDDAERFVAEMEALFERDSTAR